MFPTGTIANERGFTLVELLVVMTLLALTAVITLSWLPSLADQLAVDETLRRVTEVLARAAHDARNTGQDQIVTFDVGGDTPRLLSSTKVVVLDRSVTVKWLGAREVVSRFDQGAVVFLATSGASGGAVAFSRGAAKASLEIDWLTGRVQDGAP